LRAMAPYCYRCPLEKTYPECGIACLEELERILRTRHQEIAAVITEPLVQGAAGMIVFPPGTLKRIADLCRRFDVLLIVDEVATGFGRTGRLFACEHEEVCPDLMAVAKGLTGGYLPLAATLASEEIYRTFLGEYHELKSFFHGHTYTGNPLACAVGLANLDLFAQERTLDHLQRKIEHLGSGLSRFRRLPWVGDIRQLGFVAGIELVRDAGTKEEFPAPEKVGIRVIQEARRRGVVLRPLGNVIVLMPPLSIAETELDQLLRVTYDSIQTVLGGAE
ncbi:MAG: aminotransferase class III-fold pyridoxal phosphate-dependent enzyme, partial [Candidatus Tectomicrobia bacterium]|nr:aminotransferase class III-fold pyridoxal phosphate-dependent enzyme [Candidatus Tectomicrobia bacterium]